jgi:KDO2-lipid IV(A) lauroyltransferase
MTTDQSQRPKEHPVRYKLEWGAYKVAKSLVNLLPESAGVAVGRWVGRIGYLLDARHRRVALQNLELAFPEWSPAERKSIAKKSFGNIGTAAVELATSAGLDRESYLARLDFEGWENFERAEQAGKGVLLMTAHIGNWEALAQAPVLRGKPVAFVARPLDNPYLEREIRRIRERFGNRTIMKRWAARQLIRTLRSGGVTGLLIDQRVHPNEGRAYDFFGHPAYTTPLMARLSLRTGAPVVPVFGIPLEGWKRFRIVYRPPIFPEPNGEDAVDRLTLQYLRTIEEAIREWPELWLWAHRRWRKGRPMEASPSAESQPLESTSDRASIKAN